jgi:molybdate transport system ATP-binding protein
MTSSNPLVSVSAKLHQGDFSLDASFASSSAVVAIFGPSGAGKTTLLNVIAGLVRPEQARVVVDGEFLNDTGAGVFVPAYRRRIGIVFQDSQLFPHLSVEQNIRFGSWFKRRNGNGPTFDAVVEGLGMAPFMKRRPASLSGGEKRRVALARALVTAPRLLLMDEPLSGLDDARREEIMGLIERVRDDFKIPIIYVTHRRDEVRRLANEVIRIDGGRTAIGPVSPDLPDFSQ